jgi:hypothetical protein
MFAASPNLANAQDSHWLAQGGVGLIEFARQVGASKLGRRHPHRALNWMLNEVGVLVCRHLDEIGSAGCLRHDQASGIVVSPDGNQVPFRRFRFRRFRAPNRAPNSGLRA